MGRGRHKAVAEGHLAVGQVDVEGGDGFGQGLVAPMMGADTARLRSTQASAIWAMFTPLFCELVHGANDGLIKG
jgi:hypothetical protein